MGKNKIFLNKMPFLISTLLALIAIYISFIAVDTRIIYSAWPKGHSYFSHEGTFVNISPDYSEDFDEISPDIFIADSTIKEKYKKGEIYQTGFNFSNVGNRYIEKSDYIKSLTIVLEKDDKIFGYIMEEEYYNDGFHSFFDRDLFNDYYDPMELNMVIKDNVMTITPSLLNPGDSFGFVLFSNKPSITNGKYNFKVYAHVKGLKLLKKKKNDFIYIFETKIYMWVFKLKYFLIKWSVFIALIVIFLMFLSVILTSNKQKKVQKELKGKKKRRKKNKKKRN